MEMKTLIDVMPNWALYGIFSSLESQFNVPWKTQDIAQELEFEYYGNISGDKLISPLVSKMLSTDSELSNVGIDMLAMTIYALYGVNWAKLWETLILNYNPIENYNMTERMTNDRTTVQYGKTHTRTDNLTHGKTGTETETPNTTETRTDNLTHGKSGTETNTPNTTETRTDNLSHGKSGTETNTPNTTETTTPNLTNGESDTINGFNSSAGVASGGRTLTSTGTNTVTKTGTEQKSYNLSDTDTGTQTTQRTGTEQKSYNLSDTDSGTQTTQRTGTNQISYNLSDTDTGTQTDEDTGTDTHTRNYLLNRSGNIGVTTSQQMLEQERKVWLWNYFFTVVFPDVDRVLTLQIY